MGEKDVVEKILLGFNDVFAELCNAIIYNGRRIINPDDLVDIATASSYKFDGKIHSQERDVTKLWKKREIRLALMGIENQSKYDPDMVLRIFCYDGAGYKSQLTNDDKVGRNEFRYPVVTFVLNFSTTERWKIKRLYDRVKVPKSLQPFVSDYKINVIDLAWLDEKTKKNFHGDMRFIIEYLSAVRQNKELKLSDEVIKHYNELTQLFSLLSGVEYETAAALFTEEEKQKGEVKMNEYMTKMFAKAEAKGKAEGRAEGETKGLSMWERLINCLIDANRESDVRRAAKDEVIRNRFFAEFGIA